MYSDFSTPPRGLTLILCVGSETHGGVEKW